MKHTEPSLRKEPGVRVNYRATAEYFEQRARRQRRPSMRAHYAAEAERYRQLAKQEEETLGRTR